MEGNGREGIRSNTRRGVDSGEIEQAGFFYFMSATIFSSFLSFPFLFGQAPLSRLINDTVLNLLSLSFPSLSYPNPTATTHNATRPSNCKPFSYSPPILPYSTLHDPALPTPPYSTLPYSIHSTCVTVPQPYERPFLRSSA
jgi:hypothetical protein